MTRFSQAFGEKYDTAVAQIRTRGFSFGGFDFKVRLPLSVETEAMYKRMATVDEEQVKARIEKMTEAIRANPVEGVVISDDDVVVDGRSTREVATSIILMEQRITEYFRLLVPENGTFDDVTYEEIDAEFPLPTQLELIEAIADAIQPGYKDTRKNS